MLAADVVFSGALMLCWTRILVALQVSDGQQLIPDRDSTLTEHTFPSVSPCFVDDIFAALREDSGTDGELTNSTLTLFGICSVSDNSSGSVLAELAQEIRRNQRNQLKVLYPTAALVSEDEERGSLLLAFDLPQSPLLTLKPVLLLAFESPVAGEDLDVTFTSQSLQPSTQSVCISRETQYLLLTGRSSEGNVPQKWRVSARTKSPDMKQNLKDILIGGKSGNNISMIPLLLFSGETGTNTSHAPVSGSSQTSFLCELKRFLGAVLPRQHPEAPLLQLDSLKSLPPLKLALTSSETLLAGTIRSSAPTILSFAKRGSVFPDKHGELALSPALLEELRRRLEHTVARISEILREEKVANRAVERLERLREVSVIQWKEAASGETQFRALLLLKALHSVTFSYDMQRRLRATRKGRNNPAGVNVCGLRSLTVSLERHLVGPHTANINNCYGSCAFPLTNANNHVVLLNSHIESSSSVDERAPCCVPVAYEALEVMDWNEQGTYLSIKQDIIAKECGCR
ncbi:muellerian-inhibiting factor isoform X1 [Amphiprion ocellaris]|uniref:TGF-beta family profile domain-containing protein n=1 Tax=Amphiprion ocellaris TaxID=80972 RepID=A0A3Q1B055_AMPOC|nr:muellerian-inhibiting factor isoform X1 [Amphiprion ocellaris]